MAEYIEREAYLEELKERHDYVMQDPEISKTMKWCEAVCYNRAKDILETLPAADVVEVVHGRWEDHGEYFGFAYHCSACNNAAGLKFNYCPNCGARMDGDG